MSKHLLALALLLASAPAQDDAARLHIEPPSLQLDAANDAAPFTVLLTTASGFTVDVTAKATANLQPPGVAELRDAGASPRLVPLADGEAELVVQHEGRTARAAVRVRKAQHVPEPSFSNDVLPVLTHAGCNAGSCHGAASGKNGFSLSLFAYDPGADHRVLTHELRSRRVDPAEPAASLMLLKAGAAVPHQGGKRLPLGSEDHRRVLAWIEAGAGSDVDRAPVLRSLTVHPDKALLQCGQQLPLRVVAHYADDSDRDVTELTLWSSNDDGAVTVVAAGRAAAKARGEATLLARYGGAVATACVQVLPDDAPWTWPDVAAVNFVDTHVQAKLRTARIVPAPLCSDEVFVRRVHLDLVGMLPTPEVARAFVADASADKRSRLVDELLRTPEFAAFQAMAWAEVLRADADRMEPKGASLLTNWLRDNFAAGVPFDAIVRELLTSEGPTFERAPANFWLAEEQPNLLAEHVAQNFLGIRVQCAQCHNHPFEKWTMDDYYGFAAFFAQVGRKRAEDGAEWIVWDRRGGDVRHKRTGAVAAPKFLGGDVAKFAPGQDHRAPLAAWLTDPANPWFARNAANRVWARLFGRGLVDPVDDVRIGNPPSHPALLDELGAFLVREHFDLRALHRLICNSRTYQQASHKEAPPARTFAGNVVRRLSAEQLLDAIGAVTGVPTKYPGLPLGAPATAIAGARADVRFLEVFGRPARQSACTCDRRAEPTLGQTLHLVNGDTLAAKIANKDGRLQRLLAANTPAPALLDELFRAAYSRPPRADEAEQMLASLGDGHDPAATKSAWQDVFWAVLNSREFLFQH